MVVSSKYEKMPAGVRIRPPHVSNKSPILEAMKNGHKDVEDVVVRYKAEINPVFKDAMLTKDTVGVKAILDYEFDVHSII